MSGIIFSVLQIIIKLLTYGCVGVHQTRDISTFMIVVTTMVKQVKMSNKNLVCEKNNDSRIMLYSKSERLKSK